MKYQCDHKALYQSINIECTGLRTNNTRSIADTKINKQEPHIVN
jgi:hypothetical protein